MFFTAHFPLEGIILGLFVPQIGGLEMPGGRLVKSFRPFFCYLAVLGVVSASAQLEIFPKPYKNNALWTVRINQVDKLVDTLFVGASFTRTSLKPVTVTLKGNEAGWSGDLLFVDPKTGIEDRLFSNHDTPGTTVTLSDRHDISIGDTVYFVYRVTSPASNNYPSVNSRLPKYTGPNLPGVSKYVSAPSGGKYGHRWSVAGRMNDSLVIFGFEDNVETSSDFDYDDIVFLTTLSLANDEVPAHLTFTDRAGKSLEGSLENYSPANDTVYIVYTDDYTGNFADGAKRDTVFFNFKVRNRKGTAAPDEEIIVAGIPFRNGITGKWSLAVPIQEKPGIPGNKILETFFLGEITATVKTHDRNGLPDGNTVTASLNVAYADKPETVKVFSCPDSTADITRLTTCVNIKVDDQSFTRYPDTVWAEIKCPGSGDVFAKVPMIEQAGGGYKSGDIVKNETVPPSPADKAISCLATDAIVVTYVDEIYNNRVTDQKAWSGGSPEGLYIAAVGNPGTPITSIKDGDASAFTVVVKGPSATVGVRDTILVTLTTAQGESETVAALETDVNSNVFTVDVGFGFQILPPAPGNGKIEGYLNPMQPVTSVPVSGAAIIGGKPYAAIVTLLPALNLVKNAYIKDADGDGRGDMVFIVFSRPVEAAPASLTPTYWNSVDAEHANKTAPVLTLLPGAPNVVVADFTASQFPKGATSVAAGQRPFATLPGDNIFGGQQPVIADSMGPIILSAVIKPFNNLAVKPGSTELNVDTLLIRVSEQMRTEAGWQDLLRFSKTANGACTDYAHAAPVLPYADPLINPDGSFTFLVAAGNGPSPLAGDCVYLNVNGTYTDMPRNIPPIHGEKLQGVKPPREIELFRGYPPVAGMNADLPGFIISNNDLQTDQGSEYSKNNGGQFVTVWVPPADFPADYDPKRNINYVPIVPPLNSQPVPNLDRYKLMPMPRDISAVQVISTGEYIADVFIFDNIGNWVKSFRQAFGYRGELNNIDRAAKRGMVSYLVWDMKNAKGQKAGQGVYVWKVVFRFKTGKQEIRYTRTGVMRNNAVAGNP
jgi:hypothetical protein